MVRLYNTNKLGLILHGSTHSLWSTINQQWDISCCWFYLYEFFCFVNYPQCLGTIKSLFWWRMLHIQATISFSILFYIIYPPYNFVASFCILLLPNIFYFFIQRINGSGMIIILIELIYINSLYSTTPRCESQKMRLIYFLAEIGRETTKSAFDRWNIIRGITIALNPSI